MARSGDNMPKPEDPKEKDLDPGPKRGERGEYLPARYQTERGTIREDR